MTVLDTDTLRLLIELIVIPPMQIILLFIALNIAQKNWESATNRYMALALVFAVVSTVGTPIRTFLSWLPPPNQDSSFYLGEFERIWRHLDIGFAMYFALYLFIAFWFLFQEPETPLPLWAKNVSLFISIWTLVVAFFLSSIDTFSDYSLVFFNILIIYFLFFLSFYLLGRMISQVPIPKRTRFYSLRQGLVLVSIGFMFLGLSSFFYIGSFREFAMLSESFFTLIPWVIGVFYFYQGMPTREAYFFDELNQVLVYQLQLPLDTSLDQIFQLIEENLHLTKAQLSNELKRRQLVIQYIRELSESLKKDDSPSRKDHSEGIEKKTSSLKSHL